MQTVLTLLPIDAPLSSLDQIGDFAVARNSHLIVLVLGIAAPVPTMGFPEVPAYDWGQAFNKTLGAAQARAGEIQKHLSSAGVSVTAIAACQEMTGVADLVSKNALYADYLVLAAPATLSSAIYDRCLDGGVFDAGIPIVIMPEAIEEAPQLKKILVAWHPTPHTARALRSALAIIDQDSELHIAIVDPKEHIYGPNPGDDVAAFLARKGLDVTVDRIPSNDSTIADVLRQKAVDLDADLIVIGAYGHSKMHEWLLGSTTAQMLDKPGKPLLLCH